MMTDAPIRPGAHLWWSEIGCHDGTQYPVDLYETVLYPKLLPAFEAVRAAVGHPLSVISAFRSLAYNRKVGGEPTSYHTKGMALDVTCGGAMPLVDFASLVVEIAKRDRIIRGVGFYPDNGFVHFDVRPTPALGLWRELYRLKDGKPKRYRFAWSGTGAE